MIESWKDITGYEGLYQISNLGNVKALYRQKLSYSKGYIPRVKDKILTPHANGRGYLHVLLTKNKKSKTCKIHRMVAKTFVPNPNNYNCVNHIDGNQINNCDWNLEWCTLSENTKHAFKLGLMVGQAGSKNPMSKLTDVQVIEIRSLYKTGNYTLKDLEFIYKVKFNTISRIVNYKVYKNI